MLSSLMSLGLGLLPILKKIQKKAACSGSLDT
jgi:hypothetical protein